jgi:hypothetical protein
MVKLLRQAPTSLLYYIPHEESHKAVLDFALGYCADVFMAISAQMHMLRGPVYILERAFLIAQFASILEPSLPGFINLLPGFVNLMPGFVNLMPPIPIRLDFHVDLRPPLINRGYGHGK